MTNQSINLIVSQKKKYKFNSYNFNIKKLDSIFKSNVHAYM